MGEANAFVCLGWREGLSSGSAVSEPELVRQAAEDVGGSGSDWSPEHLEPSLVFFLWRSDPVGSWVTMSSRQAGTAF